MFSLVRSSSRVRRISYSAILCQVHQRSETSIRIVVKIFSFSNRNKIISCRSWEIIVVDIQQRRTPSIYRLISY